MPTEGLDHGLLLKDQHRGMWLCWTQRAIRDRLALPSFLDRRWTDPVTLRQRSYALFTPARNARHTALVVVALP
jgi:hypothetical protein